MLDRFWEKVRIDVVTGCHLWTGAISRKGYGFFLLESCGKQTSAHRAAYRLFVGPIPEGTEVEHRCHTDADCDLKDDCPHRRCVNPAHLEAISHHENILRGNSPAAVNARKTHCLRGHELNETNVHRMACGGRACRPCRAFLARERRRAAREGREAAALIPRQRVSPEVGVAPDA